jgi:hypothetical protein
VSRAFVAFGRWLKAWTDKVTGALLSIENRIILIFGTGIRKPQAAKTYSNTRSVDGV